MIPATSPPDKASLFSGRRSSKASDNTVLHVICLHASERHGLLRKGKVKKNSKAQIETISRVGRVIWVDSYIAIKISDSFGMLELEELAVGLSREIAMYSSRRRFMTRGRKCGTAIGRCVSRTLRIVSK